MTEVKVINATNPLEPLQVSFHLRIPEYAERTGSRLFLQPAIFHKGGKPVFEAAARKHDIQLRFRYTSDDRVTIAVPEGFEFEAPSAPAGIDLPQIANYKIELGLRKAERQLQYHRVFSSNLVSVPVKHYPTFKTFFDAIHSRDNHVLTLKRSATTAAVETAGAPDVAAR